MNLEFQYQLCPTLLLAEWGILPSRFCIVLNGLSNEIRADFSLRCPSVIYFRKTKSTPEWELDHDKEKGKMMDNMTDRTETDTPRVHGCSIGLVLVHTSEYMPSLSSVSLIEASFRRTFKICAHAGCTFDNFWHRIHHSSYQYSLL